MSHKATTTFDTGPVSRDEAEYARKITTLVYALQAIGLFIGVTYIAAVIVNYLKRKDVKGTWCETHFRWQIRTFWGSLIIGIIGFATYLLIIGYFIILADGVWVVYRIIRGYFNLRENKAMYGL
ncbi:MAG: hypothetical protein HY956_05585 [Deltaproteobacteria bacterium]|nr:hypothetical protein [Deltaproteobacteria bacterium]